MFQGSKSDGGYEFDGYVCCFDLTLMTSPIEVEPITIDPTLIHPILEVVEIQTKDLISLWIPIMTPTSLVKLIHQIISVLKLCVIPA